jgi:2'-hydroxyisoflavone reductase
VNRYVHVSAVMVYGTPPQGPVDEGFPVVAPAPEGTGEIDGRTYGPLKVACERVVHEAFSTRATVLRPQVIVGPGDDWPRYAEWARRALRSRQGEPFAAPGDGSTMLQVIDVRDVARFAVALVERNLAGTFNLAGPRIDWRRWVGWLGARDVRWTPVPAAAADPDTWPLYRPPGHPLAALMHIDARRALAAGLVLTDPEITARDVLASLEAAA